jgi:hypothetical protein
MKNLFKALAQFQQEVPVIFKGSTAGQGNFAYQYTDLPAIFKVINPLLAKHGLGFSQITEFKDGHDYLVTIVFHIESGETLETRTRLMPEVELKGQNVFQSYGSQLTYFRRYGISQILGLVTDKDTDAQGEQLKKKPTITVERFEKALVAIQEGKAKVTDLDKFELSEIQQSALKLL